MSHYLILTIPGAVLNPVVFGFERAFLPFFPDKKDPIFIRPIDPLTPEAPTGRHHVGTQSGHKKRGYVRGIAVGRHRLCHSGAQNHNAKLSPSAWKIQPEWSFWSLGGVLPILFWLAMLTSKEDSTRIFSDHGIGPFPHGEMCNTPSRRAEFVLGIIVWPPWLPIWLRTSLSPGLLAREVRGVCLFDRWKWIGLWERNLVLVGDVQVNRFWGGRVTGRVRSEKFGDWVMG